MCVYVYRVYIFPHYSVSLIWVCQRPSMMPKSCHGAQAFMPWHRAGLKVRTGRVRMQLTWQPVHYDWLLCCKILWNLTINSISLHHICKQWWKPSGAAKRGAGAGSTCPSQPFQMAFWVMSQHCWKVEKGHWGWQIMIFKSKQSPQIEETHLFFKSPCASPWPQHKGVHWVVFNQMW